MAKWNPLNYILPPEEKIFYVLFEDSAKTCKDLTLLYNKIINGELTEERIIEAKSLKHKSNALAKKALTELNNTFVTPIEREDIQAIATHLNKIAKKIVKACVNLRVYRLNKYTENMKKQGETLEKAADELIYVVSNLRKVSSVKDATESNIRMKEIESHGDEILYHAMDELFSGKYEALEVIKIRDIYKDIENALDICYSVSDEVLNVVLKSN